MLYVFIIGGLNIVPDYLLAMWLGSQLEKLTIFGIINTLSEQLAAMAFLPLPMFVAICLYKSADANS